MIAPAYHVHQEPVPTDGDCEATKGHLDPNDRGDEPSCDDDKPETCEVGDLSGKHGEIEKKSYSGSYTDLYASTKEGSDAFVGNRSIVVHNADGDRVTCGSFKLDSDAPSNPPGGGGGGSPQPTGTGVVPSPTQTPDPTQPGNPTQSGKPTETTPPFDGAGTRSNVFSAGAVLAAAIAFAW